MAINLNYEEQIMCTDISGLFGYRLQTCHSAIYDIQLFLKSKTDVSFGGALPLRAVSFALPGQWRGWRLRFVCITLSLWSGTS